MFESESVKKLEGKFFGVYRAIVIDIDDPRKLGRVKVECPSVYGKGIESPWAYCMTNFADANCGVFTPPPKNGAYVWMLFEKGDPNNPVWSGSPYTKSMPDVFCKNMAGSPRKFFNVWGIVSPNGHSIIIDDDKDADSITLKHKSDTTITLDKEGSVVITNKSTSIILLEQDGTITLKNRKDHMIKLNTDGTLDIVCDTINLDGDVNVSGTLSVADLKVDDIEVKNSTTTKTLEVKESANIKELNSESLTADDLTASSISTESISPGDCSLKES